MIQFLSFLNHNNKFNMNKSQQLKTLNYLIKYQYNKYLSNLSQVCLYKLVHIHKYQYNKYQSNLFQECLYNLIYIHKFHIIHIAQEFLKLYQIQHWFQILLWFQMDSYIITHIPHHMDTINIHIIDFIFQIRFQILF